MRLWDKGGAIDAAMLRFTARDDWSLDRALLPYDIRASQAHVRGLGRIGALAASDVATLDRALGELAAEAEAGTFAPTPEDEDGHTAIENALVGRLGDVGKRVHLGRSRNDQVLVALRLYERDALAHLAALALEGASAFADLSERTMLVPMPGYTHLQRAVPSSLGLWAGAFADGLGDAAAAALDARGLCDRCPLGAAAGYGVNLPLDREGVAHDLGFADVAWNPIASQTSRGLLEVQVLGAAWLAAAVVRRLAWDLSLFATSEFGFATLAPELTTGSSIMPNKRNPDVIELLRASCGVVQGAMVEIMSIASLPSGYHRDLQLTKAPLLRGLEEVRAALALLPRVVAGTTFHEDRLAAAIDAGSFATDRAVDLARQGVPFRDAYRQIAADLEAGAGLDPVASLRGRVSPGAPGDPRSDRQRARLRSLGARLAEATSGGTVA